MPRGELSSGKFAKRHPLDWYVEQEWVTEQLIRAIGFDAERAAGHAIWDPAAGMGNIGAAFEGFGFAGRIWLSDVVRRVANANFLTKPRFFSADFLEEEVAPARCSIVCNPPYSYRNGAGEYARMLISEAFARHAIKLVRACGGKRVCLLLPAKWLASQGRYRLFAQDHVPSTVLHLTQRPSMPPGDRIAAMGGRAFRGGMVDYCWIVWDVQEPARPGDTRTIWLPPLTGTADASDIIEGSTK
ncbi:MAG: hypothetical protein ACOY45_11360 [Pseudomonadota bacterium]